MLLRFDQVVQILRQADFTASEQKLHLLISYIAKS